MRPTDRTATELLAAQAQGETAESITDAYLAAVEERDSRVRAFLRVDAAAAREQARAVDRKRKAGRPLGRLAGVPVAVKDNLCTRGTPTTAGSRTLENFVPPYDAHVVEALRSADAVLIGKTNMDEFAMGSSTENSAYFPTRNPWDLERTPGGSSGGSAAAVAASEVPLALGSDTGGSIRQPASFCGVVGLKPTYGRVSRYGLVAFASSLDQVGPFAHDVTDAARLSEVIAGHDPRDTTSVAAEVPPYSELIDEPLGPLRIGIVPEHFGEGLDSEVGTAVREAVAEFRRLGATVTEVSLPNSRFAVAAYYVIATAEASSNLARYDGVHYGRRAAATAGLIDLYERSRGEAFGGEVKRRILLGTFALSSGYKDAYYLKALQVRRLIRDELAAALAGCDVIAGPTAPTPAFKIGEKAADPLAMYLSDVYTISCNLAGLPGLSVPCGFTRAGLPVGLQLVAGPFEEAKLLRAARAYERATGWHARRAAP
jgi:aspartyl-tRNA(Asn)/glutamyl-tRNA(Gln) amidotransferase subunit A